jgi:hypothetical protein
MASSSLSALGMHLTNPRATADVTRRQAVYVLGDTDGPLARSGSLPFAPSVSACHAVNMHLTDTGRWSAQASAGGVCSSVHGPPARPVLIPASHPKLAGWRSVIAGGRPAGAARQARDWCPVTMVAFVMVAFCCACDDRFIPMADGLLDVCGACERLRCWAARHAGAVRKYIYIYIILMIWAPGIIGYALGAGP